MPELLTPELVLGQREKILLIGEYGTGKTQIALSAPDPIWAIGVGGLNEFKTRYSKHFINKVGKKEVYVDSVIEGRGAQGTMLDNPTGFDAFCDTIDAGLEWNDKQGNIIESLVIDNATILEIYQMNKAIAAEYMMAGNVQKTTLTREREYGIRKPGDNTYAGAQSLMDRIVGWLFELPFHIILVSHEYKEWAPVSDKPNERNKRVVGVKPLFVGQQRINIPNMFDNVFRNTVSGSGRTRQFYTQTVGDDVVAAKVRVGGILQAENEKDLNLTDMIDRFKAHGESLTEK
jgi:hypothetical protein